MVAEEELELKFQSVALNVYYVHFAKVGSKNYKQNGEKEKKDVLKAHVKTAESLIIS